jgi:hypothetical protein
MAGCFMTWASHSQRFGLDFRTDFPEIKAAARFETVPAVFSPRRKVVKYLELPGTWRPASIPDIPRPEMHPKHVLVRLKWDCTGEPFDPVGKLIVQNCLRNCIILADENVIDFKSQYIFTPNFIYFPREWHKWSQASKFRPPKQLSPYAPGIVTITSAIYYCYWPHFIYFHLIAESLPLILSMDRETFSSSTLLLPRRSGTNADLMYAAFDLFDVRPKSIYHVENGGVFVRDLHICNPFQTSSASPRALRAMLHHIFTKLNLTSVRPFRRSFVVREPGKARSIINMEEVWAAVTSNFSSPKFEVAKTNGSLISQIFYFRYVECIVGIRGSGLTNVIWMMPNTVMVEIQARWSDCSFYRLGLICGLWVFETGHPLIHRFHPSVVDVSVIIEGIKAAFRFMKWNL